MPSSSGVVDAVVIGVGHNGLVAAAMLADAAGAWWCWRHNPSPGVRT